MSAVDHRLVDSIDLADVPDLNVEPDEPSACARLLAVVHTVMRRNTRWTLTPAGIAALDDPQEAWS